MAFADILSSLRHSRGISQRKAAADLKISQALLSHYENGAREPGLLFVCRACDYYGVSADYLLGRTDEPEGAALDEPFSALSSVRAALRDRDSAQVEAAVTKYLNAASRRLSAEIYGIADARTLARCSLEEAEAEHAITGLFPAQKND
ncbi:MAG: helix-turn-helix domain-containing protein [Candidatus Heteroscillospira sp.]|jgi:transcriptional regulator with XRE-family HTH domain